MLISFDAIKHSPLQFHTMTSSLNPNAQAWKPFSKHQGSHPPQLLLPHVIYSLPRPTASPPSPRGSTGGVYPRHRRTTPNPDYQLPQPFRYFQPVALPFPQPYYFPASENFYTPPSQDTENSITVEMNRVKGRKCPRNFAVRKYGKLRSFPPRMRGGVKFSPQPERKVWSPVKLAFSGVDGAAPPPPPSLSSEEKSTYTTVMIKNIPNQLRRNFMLKYLDQYCKKYFLEYDFMYLPMDFKKRDNYGYAFVNFTSVDAASRFKEIAQGFKWGTVQTNRMSFTSKKVLDITWATIQGKEGLIRRFQESNFRCDRLDYLPVVLDPPRNGLDPNPPPPMTVGKLQYYRRA